MKVEGAVMCEFLIKFFSCIWSFFVDNFFWIAPSSALLLLVAAYLFTKILGICKIKSDISKPRRVLHRLFVVFLIVIIVISSIALFVAMVVAIFVESQKCNPSYMSIISVIVSSVLTVVGLLLTRREYIRKRIKDSENEYKNYKRGIDRNYPLISKRLNDYYQENSSLIFLPIVHKEEWVYPFGREITPEYIPTSRIRISGINDSQIEKTNSNNKTYKKIKKKTMKFFSYGKKDASEILAKLDKSFYSFQAPTYGLIGEPKIDDEGGHLPVCEGTYSTFVDTCFGYKYSAYKNFMNNRYDKDVYPKFEDTFRKKFPYDNYNNRFAKIGIITLLVLLNVKDDTTGKISDYFLIHDRKGDVIEATGQVSTIPEGAFQPPLDLNERRDTTYRDRYFSDSITYNIAREFAEELFGKEELHTMSSLEMIEDEYELLKDKCYYLGIGFNPVEGHTELITIASIDMDDRSSAFRDTTTNLFAWKEEDDEVCEPTKKVGDITKKSIERRIVGSKESRQISLEEFIYENVVEYSNRLDATPGLQMIAEVLSGKTINSCEDGCEDVFNNILELLGGN
jgi:hypothetical protein